MAHGKILFVLKADVALVGGTGVGDRLAALGGAALHVPTPFGVLRGRLIDVDGLSVVAVRRHAEGHKTPPHMVRYEAIADGLRRLGVRACFSTAAVGSLHEDWPVGQLAVCTDILDLSCRRTTLFDREVRHTDFSSPFPAARHLRSAAGEDAEPNAVYACMDGPRYETPHEITILRQLGADVVGMTAASEAIAMREAGVPYGCLAVVTNLGCGLGHEELAHDEVTDVMESRGERIVQILLEAARVSHG